MLTAWDKARETALALPDHENGAALARVRERTRQGELVCPTCQEALWLHAGEVLVPHFAHRRLSDCPQGRVSEAVLGARRLLYRFFQARIQSGKLPAEIVLEPRVEGLPPRTWVDLMLRRTGKSAVHVVLIDRGLRPEARAQLRSRLRGEGRVFRPVFLSARLKHPKNEPDEFLLDPTEREFCARSPYDLTPPDRAGSDGSVHFINVSAAEWTTLRCLRLLHEPQVFGARAAPATPLDQLLWSESHAEWVHPGEAEALRAFRAELEAEKRRKAQARASPAPRGQRPTPPAPTAPPVAAPAPPAAAPPSVPQPPLEATAEEPLPPVAPRPRRRSFSPFVPAEKPEPLPEWIAAGLVCLGCGKRTTAWQTADPTHDRCVCRACFAAGARQK